MPGAIGNIALPEGWKAEPVPQYDQYILIHAADSGGCVTVDLKQRVYRLGYVLLGKGENNDVPTGRGWKDKLIGDAVKCLGDILK